jgi:hypothetical protein
MPEKLCQCCGSPFEPRPQVPNQSFCPKPACQLDRRKRWSQQKMQSDPDYRDNQRRVQRAWHERNPDYWREYRNRPPTQQIDQSAVITQMLVPVIPAASANSDASSETSNVLSGLYWIEILPRQGAKNMDALIVEITPACLDCSCKKDACKYRT